MKQFRFHCIALPHTQTHPRHECCAFTWKLAKFLKMMKSLGHVIYHYGAEGSEVEVDEHIDVISTAEQEGYFGKFDSNKLYNPTWSFEAPYWKLMNDRTIAAMRKRVQPGDIFCILAGSLHKPIEDAFPEVISVEPFIGYNGPYCQFRVYESYSHMHRIWGQYNSGVDFDGRFYETVIPNYFDPDTLPLQETKQDYFLYLGRLVQRKGVMIAVETCKRIGAKLILAGQGCVKKENNGHKITCEDGMVYEYDNLEHVGCVIGKEKSELFRNAKAVFTPTIYVEPFGGVAVEAQLAGTPVITTDWGAFTETVEHGRTGYRCRTLDHFIWAAKNVDRLDSRYIHHRAVANYSMNRIRWQFQEFFEMLSDVKAGKGWYEEHPERMQLDWLRFYP